MAHVGTIASSSSPCGPSPAGSSRQLTSNRKKIGGVLRNLSPRRGAQSPVADDDDLFPEDRIRIGRVDKTLEERRDYSSQMSIQQLAKVKAFETNANAKARRKKLKWYIIDPQSTFMQLWDALTAIALIFTALVTPLEVGFLPAPECPSETLFIVNRLVDSIFIFDMTLQFFLSHPVKMNVWEVSLKKIAKRYLEGWFILDIFSIFPSIFDIIPVLECGNTTDPSKKDPATALRVVRALRLLKLLRLMKTPFALVRRLIVRIATPRATVTVLSLLFECLCVSHLFACILGMSTTMVESRLHTWFATHGYCRPAEPADLVSKIPGLVGADGAVCEEPAVMYLQCLWWSVGMLFGAPISLTPDKGPFPEHYYEPSKAVNLRVHEQILVVIMKCYTSFHWTTVIARFVFVFNNLDAETKTFQLGWDNLNRFVGFYKIEQRIAMELREFYIERNKEVRARSRRKLLQQFSPFLTDEVVWELDKKWLVKIPAFSLVYDRVKGEELRFFIKAALSFDHEVFVPKDRPPARRLYIINEGVALFGGKQLGPGDSWGSQDVFLRDRPANQRPRAYAMTYLHVMWISVEALDKLKQDFPRAYLLARLWTMMNAVGEYIVAEYRRGNMRPVVLPPDTVQRLVDQKQLHVIKTGTFNKEGFEIFVISSKYVKQPPSLQIVKLPDLKATYRVIDLDAAATAAAVAAAQTPKGAKGRMHMLTSKASPPSPAGVSSSSSSAAKSLSIGALSSPTRSSSTPTVDERTWNPLGSIFSNRELPSSNGPATKGKAGDGQNISLTA